MPVRARGRIQRNISGFDAVRLAVLGSDFFAAAPFTAILFARKLLDFCFRRVEKFDVVNALNACSSW